MIKRRNPVADILRRRRGWTPIAVLLNVTNPVTAILLELAQERRWQLRNLNATEGQTWSGPPPVGALVDVPAADLGTRRLLAERVPTVRVGQWPDAEDARLPAVISSGPACGVRAADHFAQRDFKHVAYVGSDPWGDFRAVYDGLAARAAERGMRCHLHQNRSRQALLGGGAAADDVSVRRAVWEARQREFTAWLRTLPLPVGLLGAGDIGASRYCEWALAAGLRVPEDVAVLGIGNDVYTCETAAVPLSSIAHDYGRIARTAVELLAGLLAGQPIEQATVSVPPLGLVTRQSTDVLAASDPHVVEALRFMWEHVAENLAVEEIVASVPVSRRKLERAFRQDLGRGIAEEYRRRRLEEACKLLLSTDLQVAEITRALHFPAAHQFFRAFRAAYGITPAQYRRRRPDTH